ncbi:hypothetical protein E2I00_008413 [Balaenoptera physalus]|uniref:Uncharacterized protein n=1 Tax=Balaenoptera physalus TaxID=9770 RepID=A0A6A1Q7W9_BALPH|nr:hypothetical protein E2I00_008413 [Balaenoptera physalus]
MQAGPEPGYVSSPIRDRRKGQELQRTYLVVCKNRKPPRGTPERFRVLLEISRILNTGLDMETLSICVRLCEQGINPEALSSVIKELRKAAEALKVMVIAMILMKYGHIYNLFSKVLWNKYITLAAVPEHNYNEDSMKYGLLCEDIFRNPFSVNAQLWKGCVMGKNAVIKSSNEVTRQQRHCHKVMGHNENMIGKKSWAENDSIFKAYSRMGKRFHEHQLPAAEASLLIDVETSGAR